MNEDDLKNEDKHTNEYDRKNEDIQNLGVFYVQVLHRQVFQNFGPPSLCQ